MPQLIQTTVPVQNVKEGDIVVRTYGTGTNQRTERAAVGTVKVGTKWTEVRATDGALIVRSEVGMGIAVERSVATDEEKAEAAREYSRKSLNHRHASWSQDPAVGLVATIETNREKGYAERASHWDIDKFLTAQAIWKIAVQAQSQAAYLTSEFEDLDPTDALAASYQDIITKTSYPENPLSRSSSVTSNIMADLDAYAKAKIIDDFRFESTTYMADCLADVKARFASRKAAN